MFFNTNLQASVYAARLQVTIVKSKSIFYLMGGNEVKFKNASLGMRIS